MPSRARWPLLLLSSLAVGLAWLLVGRDAEVPGALSSARAGAAPSAANPVDPGASGEKRTRVPKPAVVHPRPRAPVASSTPRSAPSGGGEAGGGGAAEQAPDPTVAAIQNNMRDVNQDVGDCLTEWWKLDPSLAGTVVVGFDLTPDGLSDAWIEDHTDVPLGPLSCFSAAVYGVDWSGIVEEDTHVSYPVTFNGGAEGDQGG